MPDATRPRWPGLLAALLLIHLLLILPSHPGAMTPAALGRFPLELPALAILLAASPRRWRIASRRLVTGFLLAMTLVKLLDLAAETAFLRPFNPVLDLALLPAGLRMLAGAIGPLAAFGAILAALAALALLAAALWWATGRIAALALPAPWLAALVPALAIVALDIGGSSAPVDPPGSAPTARLAFEHVRDIGLARRDLAAFRIEAAQDPYATAPPAAILPGLAGTDVFVTFIESYGRTALENPLYAPSMTAALATAEGKIAAAGLAARSGWLTSTTRGGQSWLAHSTLLTGLRIASDGRYRALVASPRRTLLGLAREAGWHTAAVVPAITLTWRESGYFGYDTILAAADLGYRGKPFNWVTMPDQFTLAAFERRLLDPQPRDPVFAEIALISSHAPWTPIPPVLPWESLGDGAVFDPFATAGDAPEVVWRDPDRVREQFRLSLVYSLTVVGEFAARRAATPPLMIVLGDHQPTGFVAQGYGDDDVPVHVIGPPDLVARFADWGWTPGLVPAPATPAMPMEDFRDRLLTTFGPQAARQAAAAGPEIRARAEPLPAPAQY